MNTYVEQTTSAMSTLPTQEDVLALLRDVQDPHSGLDIVTLGWVGAVTVIDPQVIIVLRPPGRICATCYAIEMAIERTLHPHLGIDRLRLLVRWDTDWHPDDEW